MGLTILRAPTSCAMARAPLLQLWHLADLGGNPVFDDLSLVVQPAGDRVACGPQWVGRSTLMKVVARLVSDRTAARWSLRCFGPAIWARPDT
jgi:ATP-binding cassette subfamily F protein uup